MATRLRLRWDAIAENAAGTLIATALLTVALAVTAVILKLSTQEVAIISLGIFSIGLLVIMLFAVHLRGRVSRPIQDVEFLGVIENLYIFRAGNRIKAANADAYLFYANQTDENKNTIHDFLARETGTRVGLRDFVAAVSRRQSAKMALDELIAEGAALARQIRDAEIVSPILGVTPDAERDTEAVGNWEAKVSATLFFEKPDSQGEFSRDVGAPADHIHPLIHRVEVRLERLVHFRDEI